MPSQIINPSRKNLIRGIDNLFHMSANSLDGHTEFNCNLGDPQCQLLLTREIASGWYNLQFNIQIKEGKIQNSKIYYDSGIGYNESDTVILSKGNGSLISTLIYFPKKISKIRFDPTENSEAVIEISNLSLQKVTIFQLYNKIYQALIDPKKSIFSFKYFLKAAFILLQNNSSKIGELLSKHAISDDPFFYQNWIAKYDSYTKSELFEFTQQQCNFKYRPLISVLLPTYNTPVLWLSACINSVLTQVYDNWELCIVDDNSENEGIKQLIIEVASTNSKIKYIFRNTNGHISICSNTALSLATGDFVTFLDHDDKLSPLALYRIAEDLNRNPGTDFFYSDEDKIDSEGKRSLPFFKPDWSPILFQAQNYITHLACIRTEYLRQVNGFTEGLEGSQDYDLFLKVISAGAKVKHLPFILYHWRLHKASTSMDSGSKPYAHLTGKKALENYLKIKYPFQYNRVDDGEYTFTYLARYNFDTLNRVSIIIPTKDMVDYLKPCVESILTKSTWKNYEIIILNNNSVEERTFSYFRDIQKTHKNIRVIDAFFEFNWSKLNNLGCQNANGNYLIFLNNDISIITPDWMERLCECASLPDIAIVGASLLYEDNTLQHAGVTVGMNGWADHVFKGLAPSHFPSPYISNEIPHNIMAVTGACLVIEKSKFEKLGMFDELFMVCGSDVELGIRAYNLNYYNAIQSNVKLYHYESKSRGSFVPENDFIQSALKYEPYRTKMTDPFFNPNLSLTHTSPICKS